MDDQRLETLTEENASLKKQVADQAIELQRQRRQLEIEAALENVRLRAGAMRSSSELGEASAVLFQQLNKLDIKAIRTAVGIFDDPNEAMELWLTSYSDSGEVVQMLYYFNLHIHAVFENILLARREKKPYAFTVLSGNQLKSYHQTMSTYLSALRQEVSHETEYVYSFFFTEGTINVVTNQPLTEEQCSVMIRFAQVFGLIYTRFLDLEKAEKSVMEAQIESALERVRARAQAMQQPEELKDVTRVFRYEMGMLGKDELQTCHIYIYDEKTGKSECWFAVKDAATGGDEIVSYEYELDLQATWVGREMLRFYHSEAREVSIAMTVDAYREWMSYCETKRGCYGDEMCEGTYHLYKFSNGAIGQCEASVISHESWDLLKRVASVFSLAYSRFKDLTQGRIDLENLKEAKNKAENALAELKAAQKQLIQAEKMASLGELTAGIAHEIQNPLNFVNNFSDVNKELLEEMNGEIDKGNIEGVKNIAKDVIDNERKINHHGKRADAIVKGMLQHSRSSTGVKEPTDINALADEYLRLAYHGLRAKNNSFNATMKTDFDETIGKINIIPQDIGRVILNLITNAFYAVDERNAPELREVQNNARSAGQSYSPTVTVTTRKNENFIEIAVRDNGNGIPQHVLDKIFQPFFTTKPTGQGTGLGLSLSYDIVKAHGGEIKVETREELGTTFKIFLPIL